ERAAVRGEELVHAACEPALQLVFVLEPEVANAPLRERARLPLGLRGLVAADVDPASREQPHDFAEDVLLELDRRVRRIEDVLVHAPPRDRKSTRLNSSHSQISYAVFCLKKKKLHKSLSRIKMS